MLKPIGFWSYSSTDEEYARGRLTQLRALLASELQHQIGRNLKVKIFQDVAAIPPGADWERQIRESLDASFFFVPVVTPALLQSEWCCKEIKLFRQREETTLRRSDLIFPVYYQSIDHLDAGNPEDCYDPEVFTFLRSRMWSDFHALKFSNPEGREVALWIEKMANSICSALRAEPKASLSPEEQQREEEKASRKVAEEQARSEEAAEARDRYRREKETRAERRRREEEALKKEVTETVHGLIRGLKRTIGWPP